MKERIFISFKFRAWSSKHVGVSRFDELILKFEPQVFSLEVQHGVLQGPWLANSLENPPGSTKSGLRKWGSFPSNPHLLPYPALPLIPTQMLHETGIIYTTFGIHLSQMYVTIPYMEHMGHENSWLEELHWCGYSWTHWQGCKGLKDGFGSLSSSGKTLLEANWGSCA